MKDSTPLWKKDGQELWNFEAAFDNKKNNTPRCLARTSKVHQKTSKKMARTSKVQFGGHQLHCCVASNSFMFFLLCI
jgi:hypothetical protein